MSEDKTEETLNRFGRPTKFDEVETRAKVVEYLTNCPDAIPSKVGLAIYLDVTSQTLTNWTKKPGRLDFLGTLEAVKDLQHHKALNGGATGDLNAAITSLVLANYGYHKTVKTELTGADGGEVKIKTLADFYHEVDVGVKDDDE